MITQMQRGFVAALLVGGGFVVAKARKAQAQADYTRYMHGYLAEATEQANINRRKARTRPETTPYRL